MKAERLDPVGRPASGGAVQDSSESLGQRVLGTPGGAVSAPILAGLAALFSWWAIKQGAYFDGVFIPGAVAVLLFCALMFFAAPFKGRLRGPTSFALAALTLLALWTLASGVWSDVPAAAPSYASRVMSYAALFLLGIWLVVALRERMADALLPLVVAGGVVGIVTTWMLAFGEDSAWYVHDDATLRFPIGYRNANAALFLACMWPMLALASDNARHWLLRALSVAGATTMIELAILSQSRGSLPATILALVVFIAAMPHRLRAASVIAIAAVPVVLALPALLEVYRHGDDGVTVLVLLRDAAKAVALTSLFSLALACFVLVVIYPRLNLGPRRVRLIGQLAGVVTITVALLGTSAFVLRHGGPLEFVNQRVDEFTSIGYPDLSEQGIRYGANIGSNRGDFWRVSIEAWRDSPVMGQGAGSFEPTYLSQRRSSETPQDPHSVEMLLISEQGAVGLALLFGFLAAVTLAILRSRRLGARAALLSAGALAAGVQWLIPASYDWFWQYAGVTAPVIFLLGAAAAPAVIAPEEGLRRTSRLVGGIVCAVLGLALIPGFLSDRFLGRAIDLAAVEAPTARADFRRAANLSPWDPDPIVGLARLELRAGNPRRSVSLAREALRREPVNYPANLVLAQAMIALREPAALSQLQHLRRLSPLSPEIDILADQIERNQASDRLDKREGGR